MIIYNFSNSVYYILTCNTVKDIIYGNIIIGGIMKKIKEIILYLIFGVLTTLVNLAVFALFNKFTDPLISNVIAWVFAVIFAYITNKLFVFESKSWKKNVISKEIPAFFGARLFSLGVEEAGLVLMLKILKLNIPLQSFSTRVFSLINRSIINIPDKISNIFTGELIIKIILAVIVVILNYIFSKLIIFKKKN